VASIRMDSSLKAENQTAKRQHAKRSIKPPDKRGPAKRAKQHQAQARVAILDVLKLKHRKNKSNH